MSETSVDDNQVIRIYAGAITSAEKKGLSGIAQIEEAFRILQGIRQQPGMSRNLDLAAAEWFAFARFSVATGFVSKNQLIALSYGYYLKKTYDKQFGDVNAEAVTVNPVSEPNEQVANWGMAGANTGETDHVAYAVKSVPPFWRSIDSIMGENKGGYRSVGAKN